jgi:hypothetical protein
MFNYSNVRKLKLIFRKKIPCLQIFDNLPIKQVPD